MLCGIVSSAHSEYGKGALLQDLLPSLAPNRRRIYLVRHGQTEWNRLGLMQGGGFDIELNENGRAQARACMDELAVIPIDVVVSSHLARARETANIIHGAHTSADRLISPSLAEMRFGEFEGVMIKGGKADPELKARYDQCVRSMEMDSNLKWPTGAKGGVGESMNEVLERAKTYIDELLKERTQDRHVVLVAHGRLNKILLAALLLGDLTKQREIELGNAGIYVLDVNEDGTWSPVVMNYADHTARLNLSPGIAS